VEIRKINIYKNMMIVIDVDMEMDQEVSEKHSHITISSGMSAPSSNSDGSEY